MKTFKINEGDKSCLRQLHLQGFWKSGKLTLKERRTRINKLISLDLLKESEDLGLTPTQKGIEIAKITL